MARLDRLSADDLADLIAVSVASKNVDGLQRARIGIAADRVARDPTIRANLKAAKELDAQLTLLAQAVQADVEQQSTLAGQGALDFLGGMRDRVTESFSRALGSPAAGLSLAAGELRPKLNDFVTRFLGDVLFYITRRGTAAAPGPIPKVLIEARKLDKNRRLAAPRVDQPLGHTDQQGDVSCSLGQAWRKKKKPGWQKRPECAQRPERRLADGRQANVNPRLQQGDDPREGDYCPADLGASPPLWRIDHLGDDFRRLGRITSSSGSSL
jgi:hypothetical protein